MPTGQEQRSGINIALCKTSAEVIEAVETPARSLLGRHSDLILPDIAEQITRREIANVLQEFGETVLSKRESYFRNSEPGMTIYITPEGIKTLERRRLPYLAPTVNRPLTDNLHQVHFPKGVYVMSGGGCQFFQEGFKNWGKEGGAEWPFTLEYDQVVRAESVRGEYWQNWHYNWDGTPKLAQN